MKAVFVNLVCLLGLLSCGANDPKLNRKPSANFEKNAGDSFNKSADIFKLWDGLEDKYYSNSDL